MTSHEFFSRIDADPKSFEDDGCDATDPECLRKARVIVGALAIRGIFVDIVPDPNGGIVLTFTQDALVTGEIHVWREQTPECGNL